MSKIRFEATGGDQGYYVVDSYDPEPSVYIDNWRIENDILYHRHPTEFAVGLNGVGITEYDVNDRVCWKCEARCPDGVWFIHRLYQL